MGDRLYTDIASGLSANMLSILVLTGETSLEMAKRSAIRPDLIFENLGALARELMCCRRGSVSPPLS